MAPLLRHLLVDWRRVRPAAGAPRDYLARLMDAFEGAGLPIRPAARRGGANGAGVGGAAHRAGAGATSGRPAVGARCCAPLLMQGPWPRSAPPNPTRSPA